MASSGGPFTVTVCVTPGALSLGCSFVTLSAAHRDEHSLVQPHEHVTTQPAITLTRSPDPPAAGPTAGSSGRGPWLEALTRVTTGQRDASRGVIISRSPTLGSSHRKGSSLNEQCSRRRTVRLLLLVRNAARRR